MENRKSDSIRFSVLLPNGKDLLRRCFESKTLVKAIHKAILWDCKIPVTEQKLYYKGEQLQRWQTLEDYSIQNDDCLELKLGFDETSVFIQRIHQMSSNICRICRGEFLSEDTLQDDWMTIEELLEIETKEESENLMSSYSVPATLVMLYSSAIPEYKAYASALIRFSMEKISNCPNVSVDRCTHLALEFCASLRTVYGDALYQQWRTTLKQLLERGNLSDLRSIFQIRSWFIEMADTLSILLSKMQESNPNSYTIPLIESLKFCFREFQVFSGVLRNAICGIDNAKEEDKSIVDSLSTQIKGEFSYLLNKMENNLRLIPETARIFETSGWLHSVSIVYLDILKELNSISQLWENEQKQFQHHNDVIDSKSRMHLVTMMMIPEEKLLDAEFYKPLIHWSRFLDEELYESLKNNNITSPKKLQDWLYKLCQAIFKPQNLLFLACSNDPMKFYPNPELKLEPLHFDCFEFSDDVKDAYPSFYNNKAKERFADHQIRDDFIKYISEQIYFFRKGFDSVFGKSIIELLTYWGIDLDDINLVLKGDLNLGFNSCERTHVNHGNNESEPLMSQFLKINRQRLKITKSKWQKDGKKLGRGGFGDVYKGYAAGGFFFAVKVIKIKNKGEIDKINQEVNLLCQFSHPNIVKYYGTEEEELLRQVYKCFKLKDSQVSHYSKQILEGLKYLHERKVVHRDINCANILVDEKGCVKITDFGLARVIKQDKEYGFKADIWSFGCTVLEMLIRNIPYSHLKNLNANLELEVQKGSIIDHLPNYSLSENALDFIKQCLKRNPNKRQTADELLKHPFVNDSGF
ncbi:hypothetical protein P3X46_013402 [Hevea brasiliensis]|uniref:mitogen-activated protein kinase kinase kinase n=1 Tax=Hevea brasiliensis TaxID=3981 RepID=A0ABQ9M3F3_HEVBR|nr:hypothetical protein P3X46_013402 [Hevea brasiliensis]